MRIYSDSVIVKCHCKDKTVNFANIYSLSASKRRLIQKIYMIKKVKVIFRSPEIYRFLLSTKVLLLSATTLPSSTSSETNRLKVKYKKISPKSKFNSILKIFLFRILRKSLILFLLGRFRVLERNPC